MVRMRLDSQQCRLSTTRFVCFASLGNHGELHPHLWEPEAIGRSELWKVCPSRRILGHDVEKDWDVYCLVVNWTSPKPTAQRGTSYYIARLTVFGTPGAIFRICYRDSQWQSPSLTRIVVFLWLAKAQETCKCFIKQRAAKLCDLRRPSLLAQQHRLLHTGGWAGGLLSDGQKKVFLMQWWVKIINEYMIYIYIIIYIYYIKEPFA